MRTGKNYSFNSKLRDSSSKVIFDDPVLCAQFLKDYVDIPILKDVRPEDIEDVSERFVPLIGEERNADTVKKIRIYGSTPLYIVSLIEHKTEVDYNVSMQIFRYMVYIWEDYEKEMERAYNKGICKTKNFKYPPILPIVYYEGRDEWTAPLELKERILCGEYLQEYIPNYRYHLVELRDYSNDALLKQEDEISLIMLINKIQSRSDVDQLRDIPAEEFDRIIRDTPEQIVDMIAAMFRALLMQLNVPEQETEEMVGKVKVRKMGELFANADFDDIRRDWQKVKDARKKAERYQREAENYQKEAQTYQKEAENYQKEARTYQKEVETYQKVSANFQKEARVYQQKAQKESQKRKKEAQNHEKEVARFMELFVIHAKMEGKNIENVQNSLAEIFMINKEEAVEKTKRYWELSENGNKNECD